MAITKKLFSRRKNQPSTGSSQDPQASDDSQSFQSASSSSVTSSHEQRRERREQRHQQQQQPYPQQGQVPTFEALDRNTPDDSKTMKSFQYSFNSHTNSLFSSKDSMSTRPSTTGSSSYKGKQQNTGAGTDDGHRKTVTSIGRPLRVLHEEEFEESSEEQTNDDHTNLPPPPTRSSFTRRRSNYSEETQSQGLDRTQSLESSGNPLSDHELAQLKEFIHRHLKILSTSIDNILIQVSQSVLNLTKASINISESIKNANKSISAHKYIQLLPSYSISTVSCFGLRSLIKNILYLIDNLLVSNVYDNSKALVLRNLHDLLLKIKLVEPSSTYGIENYVSLMSPRLFPIGATYADFPEQDKIPKVMSILIGKSKEALLSDQEGSFVAPVLRGFLNENLSIITFIFGFPELTKEHHDIINYFSSTSPDLHFLAQKNSIQVASASVSSASIPRSTVSRPTSASINQQQQHIQQQAQNQAPRSRRIKFKAPFRTLESSDYVPISMSLGCNNSTTLSGTLGGYIYPKISKDTINPKLKKYANSTFGITCAHVVLNEETVADTSNGESYPFVSVPSPALINMYKNALSAERLKYKVTSEEFKAYDGVVKRIDELYPVTEVKVRRKPAKRNLPPNSFGQIVWGERVINSDKLSDIAIIKILDGGNSGSYSKNKKYLNYLGDDLNLEQFDPALMFSNLYVKRTLSLKDKKNGLLNFSDLEVFKVGSTTNYTNGRLNGVKMIYWSDGSLKTSEFIVSSACSGDSSSTANGTKTPANNFAAAQAIQTKLFRQDQQENQC
ncbi:unnamed protein product [Ambrosiozyma monospora]|uniref:Unnamed protein product n=1 Tax=Ambrosiozyma monospora TaxID=43982 RepID=A0ACB5T422_AMBMO|nr:unnamed protein product [Ambrosiozyma monospora]